MGVMKTVRPNNLPDLDTSTCKYCQDAFKKCSSCNKFSYEIEIATDEEKNKIKIAKEKSWNRSLQIVYCRNCGKRFKTHLVKKAYDICCCDECENELSWKDFLHDCGMPYIKFNTEDENWLKSHYRITHSNSLKYFDVRKYEIYEEYLKYKSEPSWYEK